MGESLIGIAGIHDISPSVYSSILSAAYHEADTLNSPATLVLLTQATKDAINQLTRDSVTHSPVKRSFTSPFLGWSAHNVAQFLSETAEGSIVDPGLFLLADDTTAEDENTLLLVQVQRTERCKNQFSLRSVRLAARFLNTEAVAVSIGAKGIDERLTRVDGDGVFSG
ncbi:uncharacterized protein N7477_007410 [Penicillium maclennaniae]|uniref:uncharacterized protein n=1 Tax=Penicillium maclennaniae TaxID=1343394 RepID=UPI002541298C|nr:uncharacterized protein N7477_007410 [Penicillium maclennaniae]KAJ5664962.1 hypothetical protein N7477_007410 [Penicillium maclennaniae]